MIEVGDIVLVRDINLLHGSLAVCDRLDDVRGGPAVHRYKMIEGPMKDNFFWLHDRKVIKMDALKGLREFLE